jgi:LmbE family N-acetylglucosaminyl deacetylase
VIPLSLPQGEIDVLLLGAHPDDIEIGCGGTLLTLAARPGAVRGTAIILTGSDDRRQEAVKATPRFLPGCDVQLHDLRDGFFPSQWGEVKAVLESVAKDLRPDLILTPRRDDAHQDHRLLAGLTTTVWRDALVLHYEIPKWDGDLGAVTHYVPLDEKRAQEKVELLDECFPSQRARDWWGKDTFLSLMRLRGIECRHAYAEGFVLSKALLALDG